MDAPESLGSYLSDSRNVESLMASKDEYDLRDHQTRALGKLSNGKILWGGVGTGKSRVAAAYYHKNEAPKNVYVITTAKKRDSFDWQEEFYLLGIGPATGPVLDPSGKGKGRGGRSRSEADLSEDGEPGQLDRKGLGRKSRNSSNASARDVNGSDSSHMVGRPSSVGTSIQIRRGTELGGDIEETVRDRQGSNEGRLSNAGGVCSSVEAVLGADGGRGSTLSWNGGVDAVSGLALEGERGGDLCEPSSRNDGDAGVYPWVLTIDSWNNIAKYADVAGAFFIFDEQRLVGSGDWTRKFLRIAKRNNWILLSGTPGDTWMDYIPVFVANNFYKNRTAFKREHVVYNTFTKFPKVDRYINVGKLMRQRAQLLVEMPYERHTKRRIVEVPLKYDKEALEMVLKKRWHIYENRPLRDVAEMFSVGRKLVNSDRSRIEMVKELWTKHPKLIVFYNFNYELEILRRVTEHYLGTLTEASSGKLPTGCAGSTSGSSSRKSGLPDFETHSSGNRSSFLERTPTGVKSAGTSTITSMQTATNTSFVESNGSAESGITVGLSEWNGHKHQPIPQTDRWLYLVQYTAGAEGWNCIETDAMVMYSRNYSWKVIEQACGRIDRLNTPFRDLWYYDFMSESFIDLAIGRSLKAKETFNEAKYARLFKG